jgi:phage tail-like protein
LVERTSVTEASVKFHFYTSDSRYIGHEGKSYDIGEMLADNSMAFSLKQQLFKPYLVQTFQDPEDALLFQVEGRYLWFQAELLAQGDISPEIHRIKIYFPKNTWIGYLPEVYQINPKSASFVERFLGIYQVLYQDMTQSIETVAKYFDPDSVDEEILRWLSGWLSIDDSYVWSEEQLRYLVKNAMTLYSIRGTTQYLKKIIQLYTGKNPFIVEHHQIEPFLTDTPQAELIVQLYGDNTYIFTVILGLDAVIGINEYKILTKIIENAKPAHMECNLVVLEPFLFLNKHSYLGINSVLGQYQNLILDGQAAISFTTIS